MGRPQPPENSECCEPEYREIKGVLTPSHAQWCQRSRLDQADQGVTPDETLDDSAGGVVFAAGDFMEQFDCDSSQPATRERGDNGESHERRGL
jgi:hypothetical protein